MLLFYVIFIFGMAVNAAKRIRQLLERKVDPEQVAVLVYHIAARSKLFEDILARDHGLQSRMCHLGSAAAH
ncbi:hypothetical protein PWG14_00600 (plasmid) [Chromobacterium amazonense]|uniref:hypothetical protein n=1 Tax=Chromobacterium amazonense TaxID=1382803 RepID=UPI00237E529F|nr:hypothetical protein [Chromobacterium amazonense]MDE1711308.1 hypothetical protein [Chromobacterium amazonense]